MRLRHRIRIVLKWGGSAIALFLLAAWWTTDTWTFYYIGKGFYAGVYDGAFCLDISPKFKSPAYDTARGLWVVHSHSIMQWRAGWLVSRDGASQLFHLRILPLAFSAAMVGTSGWFFDWLNALAVRRGRCHRCGYDRHGLPSGSVCPECGEAAPAIKMKKGPDATPAP